MSLSELLKIQARKISYLPSILQNNQKTPKYDTYFLYITGLCYTNKRKFIRECNPLSTLFSFCLVRNIIILFRNENKRM